MKRPARVLVTILGGHGDIYTAALRWRIMPAAHASAGGDGRQRRGLRLSMSVFYIVDEAVNLRLDNWPLWPEPADSRFYAGK